MPRESKRRDKLLQSDNEDEIFKNSDAKLFFPTSEEKGNLISF